MFSIADNIQNVRKRIEKASEVSKWPDPVQLLAVTKTRDAKMLQLAKQAGLSSFGENYLNEALIKQEELAGVEGLTWHFIGPIQSNKTKAIAENFSWVHSVDRLKIAQRLSQQRPNELDPLNICIQVNIDEEESKSGVLLDDVEALALAIASMPQLKLRGLMCIPQAQKDIGLLKKSFVKMKVHFDALKQYHPQIDTLSMGMSGDFELAIECGSTLVRVGTALFGQRFS